MSLEKITLSAEQWLEYIAQDEGIRLPVWIHVVSNSMYPFIRAHKDKCLLVPARPGDVKVGDIVLFPVNRAGIDYYLHRVYRLDGDRVQTMGDANRGPDGWIPRSSILGKVVLIQRGRITIDCESPKWAAVFRLWNRFWRIRPVTLLPFRVIGKCKSIVGRVKSKQYAPK